MEREGGNGERMRKCRESISLYFLMLSPFPLHFLILSPFPLHFLILSPFPRSPAARLQRVVTPCRHHHHHQYHHHHCHHDYFQTPSCLHAFAQLSDFSQLRKQSGYSSIGQVIMMMIIMMIMVIIAMTMLKITID